MKLLDLQPGDIVYAAATISNDGSLPGIEEGAVLATPGTRGVIINIGHLEEDPSKELMLVRFDTDDLSLGPAIGCWLDELSSSPPVPCVG